MKYLCLGYFTVGGHESLSPKEYSEIVSSCGPLDQELKATGRLRGVASLVENEVITICTRGGEFTTTDGPYVESKEQVGSFLIIEAADLNDAVRVASRHPAARLGEKLGWALEIRPIARMED